MRIYKLLIVVIVQLLASFVPLAVSAQQHVIIAQTAQPTPDQVKAAVKNALMSAGLTRRQKREVESMVQNYKTQTANADQATKQADAKALLQNIYGSLNPDQQQKFKASIKQSLGMDIQQ